MAWNRLLPVHLGKQQANLNNHSREEPMSVTGVARWPNRAALVTFCTLLLLGGSHAVAVRFTNLEMPPFWDAGIRFAAAGLVSWAIVLAQRIVLPNG
jgi:hypothetical protein